MSAAQEKIEDYRPGDNSHGQMPGQGSLACNTSSKNQKTGTLSARWMMRANL
jgi:hypothetical protein